MLLYNQTNNRLHINKARKLSIDFSLSKQYINPKQTACLKQVFYMMTKSMKMRVRKLIDDIPAALPVTHF